MIHEFRLSQRGKGGVFCDEGGAFVGSIPLLARTRRNGKDEWRPRGCDDLSQEMTAQYGMPIDMSSKRGGLTVIAKALNEGDVVRAQVATVLLGIPHPPSLSKGAPSRQEMIKLASQAGWQPDSEDNLIALPANEAAQAKRAVKDGFILPIHSSSHSIYDRTAHGAILIEKATYGEETLTPAQARAIFEKAAGRMRTLIIAGAWMPKLR